jgi:hypothetical protein
MASGYFAAFALLTTFAAASEPSNTAPQLNDAWPTAVFRIHDIGSERLAALKQSPGILWSVEFGSELLLSGDAKSLAALRTKPEFQHELGSIRRDEIMVAGHSCTDVQFQSWATVGGYDLLRVPSQLQRYQLSIHPALNSLPQAQSRDVVYARAQHNSPLPRTVLRANAFVDSVVARVNANRWFDTMSELANFNRNSYSAGLFSARDWIGQRFEESGLATSDFQFQLANITSCSPLPPPINLPNIIGTKVGLALPNEWVVIGAHYDSRNPSRCDGSANPQPGANDNASGCAGVIELARVFQDIRTDRSMLFMCFSGEEQGLVGSRRYVEALQANGDISKIKLMLNMDMIGYDVNNLQNARIEARVANQGLIDELLAAGNLYSPELNFITSTNPNGGSDHAPFMQAGVPAAVTWENGASAYPHYHLVTDVPSNMTGARTIAGGILKMNAAVLTNYARALEPDPPLFSDGFE